MGVAKERIYRTPDGKLVSEASVANGQAGGLGTGLAYAVGDEMSDEDAKAFGPGKAVKAPTVAEQVEAAGAEADARQEGNTIEVSNPAVYPVTNPRVSAPATKK